MLTTPTPGTRFDLTWTDGARPAARDVVTLSLTDVSQLTVDAPRAGLTCPTITTTTDGATALRVTGLPSGDRTFALPRGTTTVTTCGATTTGATAPGRVTSAATHDELAFTGGSPLVPAVGLGLIVVGAVVLAGRRSRP